MVDPPFTLYMKNGSLATTINMYKIRKKSSKVPKNMYKRRGRSPL